MILVMVKSMIVQVEIQVIKSVFHGRAFRFA